MRKTLAIVLFHACLGWAGGAEAYELIEVLSGDTILVHENGRRVRLVLAGVWVPRPPSDGRPAQYRGREARELVEEALLTLPAYIKEVEPPQPGAESIMVRIRVGESAELDLAVLLADAGLALVERTDPTDPEHVDAIRRAERNARREQRGMHDGGYQTFTLRSGGDVLDLGNGVLAAQAPSSRQGGLRGYLRNRRRESADAGDTPRESGIHKNADEAIRDYGHRMGLPPDASSHGY